MQEVISRSSASLGLVGGADKRRQDYERYVLKLCGDVQI